MVQLQKVNLLLATIKVAVFSVLNEQKTALKVFTPVETMDRCSSGIVKFKKL